jgi:arsenate reductase (thioredoxin)
MLDLFELPRTQLHSIISRQYQFLGTSDYESGRTRPAREINPIIVQAMNEIGIDISKQKSKVLTEDMIRNAAIRVNMGCIDREACPALFIHSQLGRMRNRRS